MDRLSCLKRLDTIIERSDRTKSVRKDWLRFEKSHITDEQLIKLFQHIDNGTVTANVSNSALVYICGVSDNYDSHRKISYRVSGSGPDIDSDFSPEGREIIIKYLQEKYGYDNVAKITSYRPWDLKTSVVDFSRYIPLRNSKGEIMEDAYGVPIYGGYTQGEDIKKSIPDSFRGKKITHADVISDKAFTSLVAKYQEVFDHCGVVDDQPRLSSIHPCGIVIGAQPLHTHIPVRKIQDQPFLLTQWEAPELEKLGLTKFDILAIDNLELNRRVCQDIGQHIDWLNTIDYEDPDVFDLINSGANHGLFQIEQPHVYSVIKEAPVQSVQDIAAISALIRPGPKDAGLTKDYMTWKQTGKSQNRIHHLLTDILAETGGVLVYQEQIMQACQVLAGIDLTTADEIRKAMGKKDPVLMKKYGELFRNGCKRNNNISDNESQRIWDVIAGFAEYGFNKSHALAYGFLTYQNAYLKTHYPLQFITALISLRADKPDMFKKYLHHARTLGYTIKAADVNYSSLDFSYREPGTIYYGLNGVHGLGAVVCQKIIEARGTQGFTDIWDFLSRIDRSKVNTRSVEILVKVGAFDSLGYSREKLVDSLPIIFQYMNDIESYEENLVKFVTRQEEIAVWQIEFDAWDALNKSGQVTKMKDADGKLFYIPERPKKPVAIKQKDRPVLPDLTEVRDFSTKITSRMVYWEVEYCACFISRHPLDFIKDKSSVPCIEISEISDIHNSSGLIFGAVVAVNESKIKHGANKGKAMCNIVVEDYTGSCELTLFNQQWTDYISVDGTPMINPGDVIYFGYSVTEMGESPRVRVKGKIKKV
jgi:DNA-directed DNA polymerase III PolC